MLTSHLVKFKATNKAASRALHGPDGEKNPPRANVAEHLSNQRIKNTLGSAYPAIILAEGRQERIYVFYVLLICMFVYVDFCELTLKLASAVTMIKHFKYNKEGECVWRAISIGFAGTNKSDFDLHLQ